MTRALPRYEAVIRALPCLCAATLTASRAMSRAYSAAIAESGLEITQFAILQMLETLGPMTQTELGERLAAGKTTVSRNIALMERGGLVSNEPGEDRRVRVVRVTALGRRRLLQAGPQWERVQMRLKASMPAGAFDTLLKTLPHATLSSLSLSTE